MHLTEFQVELPGLRMLDLAGSHLTGDTLTGIASLKLQWLVLRDCQLPATLSCFLTFALVGTLQCLDISGTAITDEALLTVRELQRLQHLNISQCKMITNTGLAYLASCSLIIPFALAHLCIKGCSIDISGQQYLTRIPTLSHIHSDVDQLNGGIVYLSTCVWHPSEG